MGDKPAHPDPAASVILLRSADIGFELLMVRRPETGAFAGLVVFPGGRVEEIDSSPLAEKILASESSDRAFRAAALRELAEEVGLIPTVAGLAPAPDAKGEDLYAEMDRSGYRFDCDSMTLVSRWVTPVAARRRFDTRFYLLATAGDPLVRLDSDEIVGHAWVSPATALGRHSGGEWPMILPTLSHLRWLSKRSSIEEAVSSAEGADGRTLIRPRQNEDGSLTPIHLPEPQS